MNVGELSNIADGNNLLKGVGTLGAKIGDLTVILLWVGLLAGIFLLVYRAIQYKHTVVVRENASSRKIIRIFKARSIKRDGIEYWKIKQRKDLLVSPPSSSREITSKGKIFAECYHGENGGYHWIQDANNPNALDKVFNVFPTEHKSLWISRMRRAEERRKKSGMELLLQLTPMIMSIIIVVAFMAFYGDIMETNEAAMDKAWGHFNEITKEQTKITNSLNSAVVALTNDNSVLLVDDEQVVNLTKGGSK